MTISSEINYKEYVGTGLQTIFTYTWKIYAAAHLKVYLRDVAGPIDTLLTLNLDYTVTGVGDPAGGTVVMLTAPSTSQKLIIFHDPPQLQEQDYVEGGEFPAVSHEDSLDKIVAQIQALHARALRTPESGGVLGLTLPAPAVSPSGMYIKWNAAGDALEAVATDPVVTDGCPLEMVNALDYGDGTVSYATLAAAVAAIGAEERRLYLRRGTWPVSANLTIPANITVVYERGAKVKPDNGITLTHTGEPVAGDWQIFDWAGTGAIDLSNSSVLNCYLQWWGAVEGTTADVSAALSKAIDSVGPNQIIRLTKGQWRIATPITKTAANYGLRIKGQSEYHSILYMDVGAGNDALTLGDASASNWYYFEMDELTVGGPANACKSAVVLNRIHHIHMPRVNFWLGSASWYLDIRGSIWFRGQVSNRAECYGHATYGEPAYGMRVATQAAPAYQSNVLELYIKAQGIGTAWPLFLDGDAAGLASRVAKIEGSIENYANGSGPFKFCLWSDIIIGNLYCEAGAGTGEALLDRVSRCTIDGLYLNDQNYKLKLQRTSNVHIATAFCYDLEIDADCRRTTIGNLAFGNRSTPTAATLIDNAPDTVYLSAPGDERGNYDYVRFATRGLGSDNYFPNSSLSVWNASLPEGFTDIGGGTYTKCGVGLADTIHHWAPFAAKVVSPAGSDTNMYATISAAMLDILKGKSVTMAWWVYAPTGQLLETETAVIAYGHPTVPNWVGATEYKIGDSIRETGVNVRWDCVQAGISGAVEPAWTADDGDYITDNTCVWIRNNRVGDNQLTRYKAADAGNWKQIIRDFFIPTNATGVTLYLKFYDQTDGAAATYYMAEPCLVVGTVLPPGFVQSHNELLTHMQIGANRMTWAAAAPGAGTGWHEKGDVCWNTGVVAGGSPGWVCTTAGDGAAAVWKAMGNVAL